MRKALDLSPVHSVAVRLLVGFALFAAPVVYLGLQLAQHHLDRIEFARVERAGAELLPTALKLHAHALNALADLAGSEPESTALDRANDQLEAFAREPGLSPGVQKELVRLRQSLARLDDLDGYQPAVARDVTRDTTGLIRKIGEDYKLLLDPQLDTFHLMDVAVLRTGLLMERVTFLGNALVGFPSSLSEADKAGVIATHSGRLDIARDEYVRASEAAIALEDRPDVASELQILVNVVKANARNLQMARDPAEAKRASLTARAAARAAAIRSSLVLAEKLDARIERLERELWAAATGTAVLFAAALAIVFWLVQAGLVSPLVRLTQAMRNVADGDVDGGLSVPERIRNRSDELGDMARALLVFRQTALDRIAADESARARAEFLAVMSHEIRTPLNGVLGMTQALEATQLDAAQQRMVSVVLDSGKTLLTLLNDILDFSKIEAGKLQLESLPFDPQDVLASAVTLFDERATAKGLLLQVETGAGARGWRVGDPQRLRQVAFNLISNAIKFTDTGSIRVRLEAGGPDRLRLSVTDTGIGMDTAGQARLFNRFTQTDASHARLYGGTGLGLAITKALVEAMDGTIEVVSEAGVGSTFTVDIAAPACEAPASPESAPRAPVDPTASLHSQSELSVLVAEDNPTNRLVIATLFGQIGITPDFAEDGKEAFEAWQARAYDIVLMDMQMPVWDGLTAIRAIRDAEATSCRSRTPIVTLTANAMMHQIEEQMAAGADGHAAKPVQLPQLLAAMEEAMELCAMQASDHGAHPDVRSA